MLLLSRKTFVRYLPLLAVFLLSPNNFAHAQSTDVRFATPVRSSEVAGTIPARDIGDARLTDHFYSFTGVPGDLLITIDSKNLNGDIDVFTAGELRPLLKITVYAEAESSIAKNIYLRKRENLILRVEARSPNDDSGTYRLRFGGSFEPTLGGPLAEAGAPAESGNADSRRSSNVSSVGARIEPPSSEVAAAAPTPVPTPEATPEATAPIKPTTTARTARTRRPVTRRTTPPKPSTKPTADATGATTSESAADADAAKKKQTTSETSTAEIPVASTPGENKPVRPPPRNTTARRTPRPRPTPQPAPEPERGPRLVIELNDGKRIEHFMSVVRRVTVENGQVVVVNKDGRIERIPMANVAHMSIGP